MFRETHGEVFEDDQEMDVADLFGDFDHDAPSTMDDTVTGPDDMQSALIGAGTDAIAAAQFVDRIFGVQHATTFMEMYGQGSLVTDANHKRRSLNLRGLNAFDLRTLKPDGTPWNFNVRADRQLAQKMIDTDDPDWIIGSPPCTAFSIWNRQMNYRKMDPEKVRIAIEEGVRHLAFCCKLYRRQLARGKHFLHEHPARALSWKHPQILSILGLPTVHLATADQCMYGLETPSAVDKSPAPAMKPTKFMTSSIHMARQLQKRCDHSHVHQQLVGGRCKDAAYYPLPLIRAMLQGMRDTTVAESKDRYEQEKLVQTLSAIGDHPTKLPEVHMPRQATQTSKVPKTGGGYMNISYDNWKPRYVDEYTGEVLQDQLVRTAMIDELDYFNQHVWEVDTIDHMKTVPDYILVRSRWVMANKGDSAEPDVRARLVGCEVNKTGEKNDAFFASTPPLEAKKIMFSQYASERHRKGKPLRLSFVDIRKAYFNGRPTRNLYMHFPKELGLPSNLVARLVRCAYGCRDAGHIWEMCYRGALEAIGFTTGAASPCCFYHKTRDISVVVHGDDFTALGTDADLDFYETKLAEHFELKIRGRIGEGCSGPNKIRILNRCVELTPEGLIYEADPRHVDLLTDAFNLQKSNGVLTPGTKPPDADGEATKSAADELGHNIDEDVAAIEPNSRGNQATNQRVTEKANTITTHTVTADICCALSGSVVSFSDAPSVVHDVSCYSEIYGMHPSRLLATNLGWIHAKSHVDRFTGKNALVMTHRRNRLQQYDTSTIANSHARRQLILSQLELNGKLWLAECEHDQCVTAFVTTHCHYSQQWSGDYGSMISYPQTVGLQSDREELAHEEVHSLQNRNELSHGHRCTSSSRDIVILDVQNTSNSRSLTSVNTVSTLGVHLPLESTDQPEQRLHTSPFCGVDAMGLNNYQKYDRKSIRSGPSADSLSVSDTLGSIMYSNDLVRYFRSDALINTRSYLTAYGDDYSDAAIKMIDSVYAARTPPASANKFKKRQGAKATKKLEQLESVGHELNPREATSFRALSARCNYLAQDRPDIAYSAKELCREFAVPNKRSYEKLKRCARYLAGQPRLIFKYPFQSKPVGISVYVDTDFAGCKATRRSTSGGVALYGSHAVKHWSKTQTTVCLSSGEAELRGIGDGLAQAIGLQSIARDLGMTWRIDMFTDATAAIGIARRRGMGKIRHLDVTDL